MKNFKWKTTGKYVLLASMIFSMLMVTACSHSVSSTVTGTSSASNVKYDNTYCVNGKPSDTLTKLRGKRNAGCGFFGRRAVCLYG